MNGTSTTTNDEKSTDPNLIFANDQEPLASQFEYFLNRFNRLTQNIFTQASSSSSLSSLSNPNQVNEPSISEEILKLETYLDSLLTINLKHDLNSKKIQNLYSVLKDLNLNHFRKNLDQIFSFTKKLDRICSDGENEKNQFLKLKQLALKPNHIMSYARLIAPYTSAPPAPSAINPDQPINPSSGLDLQDPSLRFLMPFPTEDVIRRGRMGQEMSATVAGENDTVQNGAQIGALLGEIRTADGARSNQGIANYPSIPSRRPPPPPPPEAEDDLFDLDLNPDL